MALLSVKQLSKNYDGKPAVHNVSFEFSEGQCVALIGPNGAGKTTILRTLAGLLKPTSGKIDFSEMGTKKDIRYFIGYLPQHPVFHAWMTGKEFLIYSGELAFLKKNEATTRAEVLLERVGLADAKNKRIGKYSGGMKQRLGIAQAIIHEPKLLMLDEPVSALDPIGRREVLTLLEELKKDMTILFSTHILSDADEISDELLLLHEGKMVESGSIDALRKKYQTTTFELTVEYGLSDYQHMINQLDSVSDTSIERSVMHISVYDIQTARQDILALATKHHWPITNFSVNRVSLEDMFMKVVNQ